jgi:hypothetical protein
MKVCLINPPWSVKKGNIWKHIRSTMPSLGLLYLAAVLEDNKIDVDVIDGGGPQKLDNVLSSESDPKRRI